MEGATTYARVRFLSALTFGVAGATLAVGAFTFAPGTERWLGFGIGAGCLALLAVAFAVRGRGTLQRLLDGLLAPICAWALVSARTIELAGHGAGPDVVRWLGFSSGAAIGAVGLISLLLHEIGLERDLTWAAESISFLQREARVEVHDYRDTGGRDPDAISRTAR